MDTKALFGGTVSVLEKVMDFRSQRHNVILSNIVNADTPGFKAFEIVMDGIAREHRWVAGTCTYLEDAQWDIA